MKEILTAWQWDGPVSEPIPYGEGHINQTYAITVTSEQGAKRYIYIIKLNGKVKSAARTAFMGSQKLHGRHLLKYQYRPI